MMTNRTVLRILWTGPALLLAGCAGSTVGSGVGDVVLNRPPYAAGRAPGPGAVIAALPITYQPGAVNPASFDPTAAGPAIAGLLADMNARLGAAFRPVAAASSGRGTAPDVRFGCITDPLDECDEQGPVRGGRRELELSVTRASETWKQWIGGVLESQGATHALLLTVEIGEYWPRQKNLLGTKEVELSATFAMSLPWLTGLDRPVSVIQLTGALVDRTGRAVRIGAEGMLARRTNLLIGSIDGHVLITEDDVAELRAAVRDDISGRPLVWETALSNLIESLTGLDGARMADGAEPARTARNPLGRQ